MPMPAKAWLMLNNTDKKTPLAIGPEAFLLHRVLLHRISKALYERRVVDDSIMGGVDQY